MSLGDDGKKGALEKKLTGQRRASKLTPRSELTPLRFNFSPRSLKIQRGYTHVFLWDSDSQDADGSIASFQTQLYDSVSLESRFSILRSRRGLTFAFPFDDQTCMTYPESHLMLQHSVSLLEVVCLAREKRGREQLTFDDAPILFLRTACRAK